jgi:hypothetical protein
LGLQPDLEDVRSILSGLSDGDPDDIEGMVDGLIELIAGAKFGADDLRDLDVDELAEEIEAALDNAPDTTRFLLDLAKGRGVDLEAVASVEDD